MRVVNRYGIFIWCAFLIAQDKLFRVFFMENLSVILSGVMIIAIITLTVTGITHARSQYLHGKAQPVIGKYEPVPGVFYTPHWYLKDPLPRNVKPKDEVKQLTGTNTSDNCTCSDCRWTKDHMLMHEEVQRYNGDVILQKVYRELPPWDGEW